MHNYTITNTQPAQKWLDSYPIGNGRMGCTFMGGVSQEVIYLNEETIFGSRPNTEHSPEIYEKIQHLRNLLLDGKDVEADKYAASEMNNEFKRIVSYGVAGVLKISLHNTDAFENYSRKLNMIDGTATVNYDMGDSHYTREYFSSYPDDAVVFRISSDNAKFDATINYEYEKCISIDGNATEFCAISDTLFGGRKFAVGFKIETDGKSAFKNGRMFVCDASYLIILCDIKSEFKNGKDFKNSIKFPSISYEELLSRHISDFSSLMNRADIELPKIEEVENISMSSRMNAGSRNVLEDYGLFAMHWQYGRYLLVSSSRPSSLPANLQGIWVDDMSSPWNSDYHFNINLQMNYWASEAVNLSDCHTPLFDYMNNYLLEAGKKSAKDMYHSRGCVVHHLSDIYGFTGYADGVWGIWPIGAAWLAHHMWEHYLFTKDEKFLRDVAYEYIRQCAIFFIDNAVKTRDGYYATVPTTVPELRYKTKDENGNEYLGWVTINSTIDIETITMLMNIYEESSKILGIDDEDVRFAPVLRNGLPPCRIGKHGQIEEWINNYEEAEIKHPHIAQCYALFPFGTVTRDMKDIRAAMKVSLDRRTEGAPVGMGWALALPSLLYSRLGYGDKALTFLKRLIIYCSSLSLLATFANRIGFQIDANFGFTAAVTEMLLQSHEGMISLLPALPDSWDHGSFRGLCARGGYSVDMKWNDHEVKQVSVSALFDGICTLEFPKSQKTLAFYDDCGNSYTIKDNCIALPVKKGEKINLITNSK